MIQGKRKAFVFFKADFKRISIKNRTYTGQNFLSYYIILT